MGNRLLPFSILALIVAIIYFFIVEKDPSILQRTLNIPYDFKMTQGQNLSAFVLGGTGAGKICKKLFCKNLFIFVFFYSSWKNDYKSTC
jgi:hypothetical protein